MFRSLSDPSLYQHHSRISQVVDNQRTSRKECINTGSSPACAEVIRSSNSSLLPSSVYHQHCFPTMLSFDAFSTHCRKAGKSADECEKVDNMCESQKKFGSETNISSKLLSQSVDVGYSSDSLSEGEDLVTAKLTLSRKRMRSKKGFEMSPRNALLESFSGGRVADSADSALMSVSCGESHGNFDLLVSDCAKCGLLDSTTDPATGIMVESTSSQSVTSAYDSGSNWSQNSPTFSRKNLHCDFSAKSNMSPLTENERSFYPLVSAVQDNNVNDALTANQSFYCITAVDSEGDESEECGFRHETAEPTCANTSYQSLDGYRQTDEHPSEKVNLSQRFDIIRSAALPIEPVLNGLIPEKGSGPPIVKGKVSSFGKSYMRYNSRRKSQSECVSCEASAEDTTSSGSEMEEVCLRSYNGLTRYQPIAFASHLSSSNKQRRREMESCETRYKWSSDEEFKDNDCSTLGKTKERKPSRRKLRSAVSSSSSESMAEYCPNLNRYNDRKFNRKHLIRKLHKQSLNCAEKLIGNKELSSKELELLNNSPKDQSCLPNETSKVISEGLKLKEVSEHTIASCEVVEVEMECQSGRTSALTTTETALSENAWDNYQDPLYSNISDDPNEEKLDSSKFQTDWDDNLELDEIDFEFVEPGTLSSRSRMKKVGRVTTRAKDKSGLDDSVGKVGAMTNCDQNGVSTPSRCTSKDDPVLSSLSEHNLTIIDINNGQRKVQSSELSTSLHGQSTSNAKVDEIVDDIIVRATEVVTYFRERTRTDCEGIGATDGHAPDTFHCKSAAEICEYYIDRLRAIQLYNFNSAICSASSLRLKLTKENFQRNNKIRNLLAELSKIRLLSLTRFEELSKANDIQLDLRALQSSLLVARQRVDIPRTDFRAQLEEYLRDIQVLKDSFPAHSRTLASCGDRQQSLADSSGGATVARRCAIENEIRTSQQDMDALNIRYADKIRSLQMTLASWKTFDKLEAELKGSVQAMQRELLSMLSFVLIDEFSRDLKASTTEDLEELESKLKLFLANISKHEQKLGDLRSCARSVSESITAQTRYELSSVCLHFESELSSLKSNASARFREVISQLRRTRSAITTSQTWQRSRLFNSQMIDREGGASCIVKLPSNENHDDSLMVTNPLLWKLFARLWMVYAVLILVVIACVPTLACYCRNFGQSFNEHFAMINPELRYVRGRPPV